MRAFVADASVAVGWVHPAQATPETVATLDAIAEGGHARSACVVAPGGGQRADSAGSPTEADPGRASDRARMAARSPAACRSRDVVTGLFSVVGVGHRSSSVGLRRRVPGVGSA